MKLNHLKIFEQFGIDNLITENTTESFLYPNVPNQKIDKKKEWTRNNPRLARRSEDENDFFEIEVFGTNHRREADELYQVLRESGYLDSHPLFGIHIDPM